MLKKMMVMLCCVGVLLGGTTVWANDSYDAGYKQGYEDADKDVDAVSDAQDDDYKSGYKDGQQKWHDEHDKSWGQRYDEAKDAVQTAENTIDTAQKWKSRLDNWAQEDNNEQ